MFYKRAIDRLIKNWKRLRRSLAIWKQRKYSSIKHYDISTQGFKLRFSTEDEYSNRWFFPRYSAGKMHEQQVTELLLSVLQDAKCFVDVGTNLGWYTCFASKRIPNGIVYGFEMDALNLELIKKNIALNKCDNVCLVHAAATDFNGEIEYQRRANSPSPSFQLLPDKSSSDDTSLVSVNAIRLDEFFLEKNLVPDVFKIDVEGAELSVLRGMEKIISNDKPIIFLEIHPEKMKTYDHSVEQVVEFLLQESYDIYEILDMRETQTRLNLKKIDKDMSVVKNTMLYLEPCKLS